MEVPGRTQNSPPKESAVFCQPCNSDGETIVAIGYCQNCNEYLCAICLKVHRKQAVSRNHIILVGDNMPKVSLPVVTPNACSEICTKHENEIVKYFCMSHDAVGCGDCMIIDHKSCKVDRIQDISLEYFNGTEHQNILKKVEQFVKDIDEIKLELQASEGNTRQAYTQAIKDVKAFKKEIIDYLNKAEREMLEMINERKKKNEMLIQELKQAESHIGRNIKEIQTKLQLQVNQANELFVEAKQVKAKLNVIDENLNRLKKDISIDVYTFQHSSSMEQMVKSCVPLGDIVDGSKQKIEQKASKHDCLVSSKEVTDQTGLDRKNISKMDAYFDCEINIKTQDDASDCCIRNCAVICPSQIIVTDANNKCVKLVDVNNKEVSKYNLKYRPTGAAVVNPNLVAVTFPDDRKIQCLTITTGNKIIECDMINVRKGCHKIAIHEYKIIGITDISVEIMSMNGQLIKSLSDPNMKRLMDIAVVPSSQMFYVSNSSLGYKAVLKFDFDGNLIATYQDKDLVDVRGLEVTKDGTVLVCNWAGNGSIHMITPDCKKMKELLEKNQHIYCPYCVTFCNETNKLFVGNYASNIDKQFKNVLKVFQLR
ncbi:transcription intermediary factor 1-alpha-like [Ruditapes philippinarum]|uniref:transcription intermediary factor 1-alpha-like n=1 Tax=Ruditapes philippinarum TaxID=129788 RepID=UPI00295B22CA|nr:transcription intermediary factor 1-alpha-like [Ruditapes philippinarum]